MKEMRTTGMAEREVKSGVTEFIHAFGNHLQTLSLVSDALRRDLPRSREIELLSATVDQMMELTSSFQACVRRPNRRSDKVTGILCKVAKKKSRG
jgi:hypothetical protein